MLKAVNSRMIAKPGIPTGIFAVIAGVLLAGAANALPSFARQTGLPCSQCHVVAFGPALTAYGRQFKLNGYVWGDVPPPTLPITLMMQGGYTQTGKPPSEAPAPHFGSNNNLSVDQVSLFYGGRLTSSVGAFAQVTYSGEDRHASWDNLDIRYARSGTLGNAALVYGISLNNNPSVQDLWNSTPAWGFPYISSGLAPSPAAAPIISGGLSQLVMGATAYAMFDDQFYLEAGAYRGLSDHWLSNLGLGSDSNPHVDGLAPYWRAEWQIDMDKNYFSLGTFGLAVSVRGNPLQPLPDKFRDVGFDATYQYMDDGANAVAANATIVRETEAADGSYATGDTESNAEHLNALNMDITYAYRQTWVTTLAYFNYRGNTDSILYAPAPDSGSNNGSPDTRGYLLQFEYVPFGKRNSFSRPWVNARIGLQYTMYQLFNGGSANYDGFGRSAADNNTLFAFFWVIM